MSNRARFGLVLACKGFGFSSVALLGYLAFRSVFHTPEAHNGNFIAWCGWSGDYVIEHNGNKYLFCGFKCTKCGFMDIDDPFHSTKRIDPNTPSNAWTNNRKKMDVIEASTNHEINVHTHD